MNLQQSIDAPKLAGPTPPEKPLPFLKALKMGQDNPMGMIPRVAYEEPIWHAKSFFGGAILISDPAGVKHVLLDNVANYPKAQLEREVLGAAFGDGLLTSDGEKWKSHRRIMSPSFDFRSLVSYAPAMSERAAAFGNRWAALGNDTRVNIADEMTKLTLEIVSRTMFSADAEDMGSMVGDTLERGQSLLQVSLVDLLPIIGKWHLARMMDRVHKTFGELDGTIYKLIARREKAPSDAPRDLLDRLIAARDAETGLGMSEQEVRDEVVIIFLAGHETTAVTMTFVWYLLSQHPRVEEKLHEELARVLGGRVPDHADLANLTYTRSIIEESMRLYPPAPGLSARAAASDDTICGQRVKKGQMIIVMPWVLHRHTKLWDEPLRFDPERFSPENRSKISRFGYLPFGGGPRICIGAQLATNEATLILATLAQRFRLHLAPGANVELRARITLRPVGGIPMVVEKR